MDTLLLHFSVHEVHKFTLFQIGISFYIAALLRCTLFERIPCPFHRKWLFMVDRKSGAWQKELGGIIRQLRKRERMTLRMLEANSGIDNSKISKIESGEVNPRLSTLISLAIGLGVHPSELLNGKFD